jgi:hypothetical protein
MGIKHMKKQMAAKLSEQTSAERLVGDNYRASPEVKARAKEIAEMLRKGLVETFGEPAKNR